MKPPLKKDSFTRNLIAADLDNPLLSLNLSIFVKVFLSIVIVIKSVRVIVTMYVKVFKNNNDYVYINQ